MKIIQITFIFVIISLCVIVFYWDSLIFAEDQLLYDHTVTERVTTETAFVLKRVQRVDKDDPCAPCFKCETEPWQEVHKGDICVAQEPKTFICVSILSTGKGISFRQWIPDRLVLVIGKDKIRPCSLHKFYIPKESAAKDIAVITFVALGAAYEQDAAKVVSSPGNSCHASSQTTERKPTTRAIDRAGMAAGLGLLVSQAKGEITGIRACFDITGYEEYVNDAKLRADIINEMENKKLAIDVPVHFEQPSKMDDFGSLESTTINIEKK